MYTFLSKSSDNTLEFAKDFAKDLKKGDVVVLIGDLGSGKTKFTEGVLSYFGLEKDISSPTFTIVNEYNANNVDIFHFDVYRLNNSDDFYNIGGEEYFNKGICIIEWGNIIEDALPDKYTKITFERDLENENFRKLTIERINYENFGY